MHAELKEAGLQSISVPEAAKLQKQGWTIVDVRPASVYEAQHIEGAVRAARWRWAPGGGCAGRKAAAARARPLPP